MKCKVLGIRESHYTNKSGVQKDGVNLFVGMPIEKRNPLDSGVEVENIWVSLENGSKLSANVIVGAEVDCEYVKRGNSAYLMLR